MPRSRHYRVTRADLEAAHDQALKFGGRPGTLSEDLLLSAIQRPYSGHYRAISRKAAALLESLVRNHGYVDGNKRTALIMIGVLVQRSGYALRPVSDTEDLQASFEDLIVAVADGRASFEMMETWFRLRLRRP